MKVELEEDENGDLILPIPDDIMESLGWEVGDTLSFCVNDDGTFYLRRVDKRVSFDG